MCAARAFQNHFCTQQLVLWCLGKFIIDNVLNPFGLSISCQRSKCKHKAYFIPTAPSPPAWCLGHCRASSGWRALSYERSRAITLLLSLFSRCDIRGTLRTDFLLLLWGIGGIFGCTFFLIRRYLFCIPLVSGCVIPGNTDATSLGENARFPWNNYPQMCCCSVQSPQWRYLISSSGLMKYKTYLFVQKRSYKVTVFFFHISLCTTDKYVSYNAVVFTGKPADAKHCGSINHRGGSWIMTHYNRIQHIWCPRM